MEYTQEKTSKLKAHTQQFTGHLGDLLESYYKLGVLHVTEKATGIATVTVTLFTVALLCTFVLIFLGLGFGWWLGEKLNSMPIAFSIVAFLLVLIAALLLLFRRRILLPLIRNFIIRKVYE